MTRPEHMVTCAMHPIPSLLPEYVPLTDVSESGSSCFVHDLSYLLHQDLSSRLGRLGLLSLRMLALGKSGILSSSPGPSWGPDRYDWSPALQQLRHLYEFLLELSVWSGHRAEGVAFFSFPGGGFSVGAFFGGTSVLVRCELGAQASHLHEVLADFSSAHRGRVAVCRVPTLEAGMVELMTVYLLSGQGLSTTNTDILARIGLSMPNGPVIIGGDWNLRPEILTCSGFLQKTGLSLQAP